MKAFKQAVLRRAPMLMGALALAVTMVGCGGGGGQIDPFKPTRILSFGDESSVITATGKKYTVNAVNDTTGAVDCASNPLWNQMLATTFGLVFAECNPTAVAVTTGKIYAQAGAKVADVKTQIDGHLAMSGVDAKTLITVLAGANDVLELYAQYPALSESTLKAEAAARGRLLAAQINRLADAGGRIILPTLPDMGLTPFANKENTAKADPNRSKLLTSLTAAFNSELTLKVTLDGRQLGVVFGDESVQSQVKFKASSSTSYTNVVDGACLSTAPVPDCTTKTLVTDATATSWLWANDTLLSPSGQNELGRLAQTRALSNPF